MFSGVILQLLKTGTTQRFVDPQLSDASMPPSSVFRKEYNREQELEVVPEYALTKMGHEA